MVWVWFKSNQLSMRHAQCAYHTSPGPNGVLESKIPFYPPFSEVGRSVGRPLCWSDKMYHFTYCAIFNNFCRSAVLNPPPTPVKLNVPKNKSWPHKIISIKNIKNVFFFLSRKEARKLPSEGRWGMGWGGRMDLYSPPLSSPPP